MAIIAPKELDSSRTDLVKPIYQHRLVQPTMNMPELNIGSGSSGPPPPTTNRLYPIGNR